MIKIKLHIVLLLLGLTHFSIAQISPGKLTDAHAEYEGISNCTLCHDLGKSVSSTKCLDCHDDIQSLIDSNNGYHSSQEVRDQECFACHSEHHGETFDMMRFDEDTFNHDLTTYILDGQHDVIECRECHKPDYIEDPEIRERENTFLGLNEDCISCHDDFHQGTLTNNNDCASCHDIEAFRPAPLFDHDETNYPLEGAHVDVDCLECHPMNTRNGKEFQEFADLVFNDCKSCHDDSHNAQLPGDCMQCHEVASFTSFIGDLGFNHNLTEFELRGSHQTVACYECHQQTSDPLAAFQDQNGVDENSCFTCHEDDDVHEGKFGTDCAECHNEESWLALGDLSDFNHDLTDYPLVGMHIPVECKECHTTENYTDPIDFSECQNCHEDYHEGEFVTNGITEDCASCHSTEAGFEETSYSVERHAETDFPLEGGHIATPCFECHLNEEKWAFRNIDSECVDCHDDQHDSQFLVAGVNDCARCHDAENWYPRLFDHDETEFPLEGRHAVVDCDACHKTYEKADQSFVEYKIQRFECVDCHTQ
jgi:hypothetical protein